MSDNLLSGLEKLGLDVSGMDNLFENESTPEPQKPLMQEPKAEDNKSKEEEFLLDKGIRCPMCDKTFLTKKVKSARARRIGADADLRPRFEAVDPTKYDVNSCPFCGYTAIDRYWPSENLTSVHRKLLTEGVCKKLSKDIKEAPPLPATYTYPEAIERYKLALYNSVVKNARASEKAYACLKISWLYRGLTEELEGKEVVDQKALAEARAEEDKFYAQAYDGLTKAISSENMPICGMDQNTYEFLLAQMAFKLGKIQDASRLVGGILVSQTAGSNVKNKARDLKDQIIASIKNQH